MKKHMTYTMFGIGIGSFAYLLVLMGIGEADARALVSILLTSGLIGWTAQIYEREKLALSKRWLLHLLAVLVLVSLMLSFNGWFHLAPLGWTVTLYALIFWGMKAILGGRRA